MKALNIVFITAADLPQGGGNTTRLKTLVTALQNMGHHVNILLEHSQGNVAPEMLQPQGEIGGAPFQYVTGSTIKPKGYQFFTKKLSAVFKIRDHIKKLHEEGKVDVLWFNQSAAHLIYPLTRLGKKLGIKIVHSYEDERLKGNGLKRQLIYANQSLADRKLTAHADHIVAISHYLRDKYALLTENKVPISIIPTIIDPAFWDCTSTTPQNEYPLLVYTGGFFGFDEVEEVIHAVRLLKNKGIIVHFNLIGYNKNDPEYMQSVQSLINELGIEEQVKMLGFVPFEQLKAQLAKADLLIGIRKDDGWSNTGFSTKLSEYLATGRPVLCAALEENCHYLKDQQNAYMVTPGATAETIAKAIEYAVTHPEQSQQIGLAGQQVAKERLSQTVVQEKLGKLLGEW
ncbi:glycosyltransferase family 4 protein [Algivirga pacifica]|uniref:Uncharacterized protein n=1 Tax=Algivirga pacifica TaxID=1162670 RepID=A0ABP9DPX6_9BACT